VLRREDVRDLRVLVGRFARPYWPLLALTVMIGLVVAALTTLQPIVLAPVLDGVVASRVAPAAGWRDVTLNNVGPTLLAWTGLAGRPWSVLVASALAYVFVVLLTSTLFFANILLVSRVRSRLFCDLQCAVYQHVLGLSMSYFVRQRAGELGSRLTNDAFQAAHSVDVALRNLLQSTAQLVFCGILLLYTDAVLTTGVLVVFAGHMLITRVLRDRIRALVTEHFDVFADLTSRVHETVVAIRIVKSFGAARFEYARFAARARELGRVILRGSVYKHVETPLREVADAVGFAVVLLMAFAALTGGRLNLAGLVLFVVLVRQSLVPVSQIGGAVLLLQHTAAASRRLLETLRVPSSVADGAREAFPLHEGIRLDGVRLAYEPGLDVLHGITLEIRRGEMVALVGPSGAGKSSIADLVVRLYDPGRGRVTWDGVDVREFKQDSYRRRFGVVSQEALLFNATVAENIAYGRSIDRAAVVRAARIAHADEFIAQLPNGYDTLVGDRGIRLSGGQRQRIAIARAVYGDPDVLVLDEATSALDSESEAHVHAAIEAVSKGITALVIAHRLSTVLRADRIVVIDAGRIVASGPHVELLASSPLYRRLCDAQFRDSAALLTGTAPAGIA
jgi:subfamily B ATP-binding cassette protein MsbA